MRKELNSRSWRSRLVAIVGAGAIATSGLIGVGAALNPAAAAPVPKLTGLKVTGWGMKSITVAWNNSGRGSYQQVQYCISGNASSCKEIKTGSGASTYTVTNLTHGKTYRFQVRAVNADGGNWSDPVYQKAGLPGKPGTPTATAGNTTAQVSWATSRNLAALNGYTLYTYNSAGTAIKSQNVAWKDASLTTANVTGLANGTAYKFAVIAKNEYGSAPLSAFSGTVTPKAVPGAPTNVALTPGNKQVTVTWAAPASGGSAITGYNVQIQRDGDLGWSDIRQASASGFVWNGLKNGETVLVRVQARNAVGAGTFGYSEAATPVGPPEKVSQPIGEGKVESAQVTWVEPDNGGSPVTGYDVRWRYLDEPENTYHDGPSTDAGTRSVDVTGLTSAKEVAFSVRAKNDLGEGDWSDTSEYVKVLSAPASSPKDVKATAGQNSITVSWLPGDPNGTPIAGYEARVSCDGGKNWTTVRVPVNQYAHTFTGLPGGKTCTTQVRALSGDPGANNSEWVDVSKNVAPIAQPAPGATKVTALKWTSTRTMRVNVQAPAKATSLEVRTAAGSSTSFGAWKRISKSTKTLSYSPGSTGITIQVRACTEQCSAASTVVAKYSPRASAASKKLTQVAGTITQSGQQQVFFQNRKSGQWRVKSGSRAGGSWRAGSPSVVTARPGMVFQLRTKNKKAHSTVQVLANGSYRGTAKGK